MVRGSNANKTASDDRSVFAAAKDAKSALLKHISLSFASLTLLSVLSSCLAPSEPGDLFGVTLAPGKTAPDAEVADFDGCVQATAIDTSQIQIQVEHPAGGTSMTILRDGIAVSRLDAPSSLATDRGLLEGVEYTYICEATINGIVKRGKKTLKASTVVVNAPVFGGVTQATAASARSILVRWNPAEPSGPAVSTYEIYASLGSSVNWSAEPRMTVAVGTHSAVITSLGDELPYTVGVRACTSGGVCDSNTTTLNVSTPDGGTPLTAGAASAVAANGSITLSAPWSETHGAVKRRRVYQRTGTDSTNLSDFTLVKTEVVSDATIYQPPTSIVLFSVSENTQYYFRVVDEDPAGNTNSSRITSSFSFLTGDLTAPNFTGASSVSRGSPADTRGTVSFVGINREGIDSGANGTSQYLIYISSVAFGGVPSNACGAGTLHTTVSAASYAPSATHSITIEGLQPRTAYSVCLKARDASGNTSTNTDALTFHTLDITPPNFDGIQGIQYSNSEGLLRLFWNASSSSDLLEYRISLWKNTTSPATAAITTLTRSSAAAATGISLSSTDYAMGDNETIYAVVNACDTAAQVTEGTQNCTTYGAAAAKSAVLPDITPPQGFDGIKPANDITTPSQGTLGVSWFEPALWSADYQGFKVYRVNSDNSLSLLKDCPCAVPGSCTSSDTSCTVSGLDAYRTYKLHVRAYDAIGNQTQLSVSTKVSLKRTSDTTTPSFSSNLAVTATNPRTLSWSSATDNQYSLEPGAAIQYLVYRKTGVTGFTTATNPSADGELRTTTTSTSFADTGLLQGNTYHYTVCARDSSLNARCDGIVQSFLVPDSTAPVIAVSSTKTTLEQKRWNVSWTVSDNQTASGSISINVYQTNSDTPETPNPETAELVQTTSGSGTLSNVKGPSGVKKYVNYLVAATDLAGNLSTKSLSVLSDNRLTITGITRANGPDAGGKVVLISGTGFSFGSNNGYGTSTTVKVGNTCNSVILASPELIACTTAAGSVGAVNVELTNPDGTTATLSGGYTYVSGSSYVCDQDQSSNQMAGGNGTTATPYLICTGAQLNRLRNITGDGSGASANYRSGSFRFQIMDNIDLASFNGGTFSPIGDQSNSFSGYIDGNGGIAGNRFGILNFTYSNSAAAFVGLISTATGNFSIKNLALINANLSGGNNTGGFLGYTNIGRTAATQNYLDNVFLSGTVTGTLTSGTSISLGGIAGNARQLLLTNSEVYGSVTAISGSAVGGLVGTLNSGGITNSKFTGTVSAASTNVGGAVGVKSSSGSGLAADINGVTVKGTVQSTVSGTSASLGGIVGYLSSTATNSTGAIIDSQFSGSVIATSSTGAIGGLIGFTTGTNENTFYILRCSSQGTLSGSGSAVGGLAGWVDVARYNTAGDSTLPVIDQSFSTMTISSSYSTRSVRIGGLAGHLGGTNGANFPTGSTLVIKDSYFAGSVSANFDFGGLVGGHRTDNDVNYLIVRSYSAGALGTCSDTSSAFTSGITGSNCGGGLVGAYYNTVTTRARGSEAIASFWDSESGGINATFLYNSSGGTSRFGASAKTTAQMKDQGANIYTAGTGDDRWDFTAGTGVWKWPAAGGYPILRWQTE